MTTRTSTKMPRLRLGNQRRYESAIVRGSTAPFPHHRQLETHKLPGIGTYIIDTPKDSNLSAREKCFRYQEIHRGVSRSKYKSLPDIPKRYDMKTLPVAKLIEANRKAKSPCEQMGRETTSAASDCGSNADSRTERTKKQDPTWKLPSQEELVSRSPIGRIVQSAATEASVSGFGVRKNKMAPNPKSSKPREFTYLSTNLALTEPEPVTFKATERELESQAEYRKQLTFYLNQMLNSENPTPQPDTKQDCSSGVDNVGNNECDEIRHYDSVGHSSKHLNWESNVRLGDMLINTTPDLRKKLKLDGKFSSSIDNPGAMKDKKKKSNSSNEMLYKDGSGVSTDDSMVKDGAKKVHHSDHGFTFQPSPTSLKPSKNAGQANGRTRATVVVTAQSTNRVEIVHHDEDGEEYSYHYCNGDDDDDDGDEDDDTTDNKWMEEVVNTRVVESGVYDKFANVKLPPSARTHSTKTQEHKNLLTPHTHLSRNNSNLGLTRSCTTISKYNYNSPFGAS